jgi:acid stress-induced BolA-like protein IbaG/YrbA
MTVTPELGLALKTLRGAIERAIPDAQVEVQSPDGRHFSARVVSETFAGLPALERHRRVYRALGGHVGGAIHAFTLEALTPTEWQKKVRT